MKMHILDTENNVEVSDTDILMKKAGLNVGMGFEGIGLQDDATPVVFDRCGGFGYLDSNEYRVVIEFD